MEQIQGKFGILLSLLMKEARWTKKFPWKILAGNNVSECRNSSEEEIEGTETKQLKRKTPLRKASGRKAMWKENHVADMVAVICSSAHFTNKLIFTNSKSVKKSEVYCNVLEELKK